MSNLKHRSYGGGGSMKIMNSNKVKDLSVEGGGGECYGEEDFPGVFSWPPRSYTCSFCKREFRSAQALGGHMNVHRRDRARLRQSPPRDGQNYSLPNLNLDPNPSINFNCTNPSFSTTSSPFSSSPTKCPPFISTLPSLFSTTATVPEMRSWGTNKDAVSQTNRGIPVAADFTNIKATKRLFELEKLGSITHEREETKMNKAEIIRLELEIGLLGEAKEDLDLELRLGYTT